MISPYSHTMTPNLIFRRFTIGSFPINGYLAADPETGMGVFIDPGGFSDELDAFIKERQITLQYLFITHGHWDHTEGLPEFTRRYKVQIYAGQGESGATTHPLRGGEIIEAGCMRFQALPIPGHTPCGISYYGYGCVFTGDALFCGSVGGTSSPKDAQRQIEHVRKHIFTLPDETLIFPAHGPMTTVGIEKSTNPFFS